MLKSVDIEIYGEFDYYQFRDLVPLVSIGFTIKGHS